MRSRLTLAAVVALVAAGAFAVPALGGPSLAKIAKQAAQALKLAKSANMRSKKALAAVNKLAVTNGSRGTNGTNGTNGTSGTNGTPGPPGPPGPSGAQKIDFRAPAGTGDTKVFDSGGLVITARCDSGPNLSVKASSTVANSELHIAGVTQPSGGVASATYAENDHLGPTSTSVGFPSGNFEGTFTYSTPTGALVTGTVASEQTAFNSATDCWFGGWALHDPA